jgi:phenylalanyl-tRNA synthetase beta chain
MFSPKATVKPGADAVEALGHPHDSVFEYEITNNRVDCYSMLGIAREAAVPHLTCRLSRRMVEVHGKAEEKTADYMKVEVQAIRISAGDTVHGS